MSTKRDYYEILGVPRTASADEIRKAHRRLARKHHPDVNKSEDAAARFAEVQEAYDVLSDAEKRKAYDQFGHAGAAGTGGFGGGAWSASEAPGAGPGGFRVNVSPEEFSSVFEELFGGRGGRRSGRGPFGGGVDEEEAFGRAAHAGGDVEATIRIPFLTAALGGVESLRMTRPSGETESVDVRIPPGVQDGGRLRLRGKGGPGRRGGAAGDLYLTVQVEAHPWFRREGLDVIVEVPITIAEAATGVTVRVPLLKGSVDLKIPAGTGSGQRLRVKGRGITDPKGTAGDFHAVVAIAAPKGLSDEDLDRLRDMAPRLGDPRARLAWTAGTA